MKKITSLLLILITLFCSLSFVGCGNKDETSLRPKIYYISTDKTSIVAVDFYYNSITLSEKVAEALEALSTEVGEVEYMMTIPAGVTIEDWEITYGNLSLYLSAEYSQLDTIMEALVRAAIVKTLVQIDGVDSISFYVDTLPLTDSAGNVLGAMTTDVFIEDFGDETDSLLSRELTLYFANADGMSLTQEKRIVYYSRNVALEKLVVEQLLKGPKGDGMLSTIPNDTKLVSVTVTNGICYVNFDAGLETTLTDITENVTVYSIVNSLTELDSVNQVQLVVNGATPHLSNLEVDLASPISANQDIVHIIEEEDDEYVDGDVMLDEDGNPILDDVLDVEVTEGN